MLSDSDTPRGPRPGRGVPASDRELGGPGGPPAGPGLGTCIIIMLGWVRVRNQELGSGWADT